MPDLVAGQSHLVTTLGIVSSITRLTLLLLYLDLFVLYLDPLFA
jgi:hypothetical protein